MKSLFPILVSDDDIPPISGLTYHPNFVALDLQNELVAAIDRATWDEAWERRRQAYGVSYGKNGDSCPPVPEWGRALAERIHAFGVGRRPFDHMLINEYLPGQGIALHRDYEPFDRTVVSLSLLSPCVMDFRHVQSRQRHTLLLEPRSLLVLSDVARYDWEHGIARRKTDVWHSLPIARERRLSVTFRTSKHITERS